MARWGTNLANRHKINFESLIKNLFGVELLKLYNSQDLIICDGVMKWSKSN